MTASTSPQTLTLEESFDRLAETANSVGDHLVAARRLNRIMTTALLLILESPETCTAAKMLAAAALDGSL